MASILKVESIQNPSAGSPSIDIDSSGNITFTGAVTKSGGTANGVLYLNGSGVETSGSALTFDGANLGLGVTPSAWASGLKAVQVGANSYASTVDLNNGVTVWGSNYYNDGGNKFANASSRYALQILQDTTNGAQSFRVSNAAGTAGNAISFTTAMTLDASGNLTLNGGQMVIPDTKYYLFGTGYAGMTGNGSNSSAGYLAFACGPGGSERARIDSSGNLLVGTTSAGSNSRITACIPNNASLATVGEFTNQVNSDFLIRLSSTQVNIGTSTANPITFTNNGSERARIDSSGNLLVGTTATQYAKTNIVQSSNNPVLALNNTNASFSDGALIIYNSRTTTDSSYNHLACYNGDFTGQFIVRDSGNAVNTNNSYGAVSDAKLKENVTDATPKLEKIQQVRVVNYNLIGSNQKQIGVIAQEIEQIFPGMVEEAPDRDAEGNDLGTTTKSVKYSVFVPMLIKAIQELKAENDVLKARLDAAGL